MLVEMTRLPMPYRTHNIPPRSGTDCRQRFNAADISDDIIAFISKRCRRLRLRTAMRAEARARKQPAFTRMRRHSQALPEKAISPALIFDI